MHCDCCPCMRGEIQKGDKSHKRSVHLWRVNAKWVRSVYSWKYCGKWNESRINWLRTSDVKILTWNQLYFQNLNMKINLFFSFLSLALQNVFQNCHKFKWLNPWTNYPSKYCCPGLGRQNTLILSHFLEKWHKSHSHIDYCPLDDPNMLALPCTLQTDRKYNCSSSRLIYSRAEEKDSIISCF